jgi:hypothetical protein
MKVSAQLYVPAALLPGKNPIVHTHCIGRWVGPRLGMDAVAKRKNTCLCRELNYGRPARRSVAVLTELPWLAHF